MVMVPLAGGIRAWWRDDVVVRRFVSDVIAGEMSRMRVARGVAMSPPWDASVHLANDLGIDSLELAAVANALNEALHLHESGVEDALLARATIGSWVAIVRAGLEIFSSRVTFRTSGSADAPKRCEHALATLWQEVDTLAPLFAGRTRVLSAVRSHHIYGFLFTALLPQALTLDTQAVVDVRHALPSSIRTQLRRGDLVVGYPEFWRAIVEDGGAIPDGVVGVTSTAPCPDAVARRLTNLGLTRLVQVYGSSETAGVGVRLSPDEAFTLLPFWERDAADAGVLVRSCPDGSHETIPLQDRLAWTGDRDFQPTGRIDGAVQVAGVNVYPAKVRAVLLEHPDVLDAAVRRAETDELGRLKAFIVPRAGRNVDDSLRRALESWVRQNLTTPERPTVLSFGPMIPVDDQGKARDWLVDRSVLSPPT